MGLEDDPFDYQITKSGTIRIFRGGTQVATVSGARARQLEARLGRGEDTDQQVLARVTGNYRRGNERGAHRRR